MSFTAISPEHAAMFDAEMAIVRPALAEVLPEPEDDDSALCCMRAELAAQAFVAYGTEGVSDGPEVALLPDQIQDYALARGLKAYYQFEAQIARNRWDILNG